MVLESTDTDSLDLTNLNPVSMMDFQQDKSVSNNDEDKLDLSGIAPIKLTSDKPIKKEKPLIAKTNDEDKLDFTGIDPIVATKRQVDPLFDEPLDLSNIKTKIDAKLLNLDQYKPNLKLEESYAAKAVAYRQPVITVPNPHQLIGKEISTTFTTTSGPPDANQLTDNWLRAIDPAYEKLNQEYRNASAYHSNLVEFTGGKKSYQYLGNHQYKISSVFQKGAQDLINVYMKGRVGGIQDGLEAVYLKQQELKRQEINLRENIKSQQTPEALIKKHPYINALPTVTALTAITGEPIAEDIMSGAQDDNIRNAQLLHNLRMLPRAFYTGYKYGWDSPEYENLINEDKSQQQTLTNAESANYQPDSRLGKIIKGAVGGAISLPKYAIAGIVGGAPSLPVLVYAENLHRGNYEAAKAALPMALMGGASHGLNEFLGAGTKVYYTNLDKNGNLINEVVEVGRGLGNRAPFARTNINIDSPSVSIGNLTSFERQLLVRGTNALFMGATSAATGASSKDVISSFVVGLTFPVGKNNVGSFSEGRLIESPPINSPSDVNIQPKGFLEQPRVDIPLTNPTNEWGSGQTLRMDLDTAVLHLLELKRAYEDKEFIKRGLNLKEGFARQVALQNAISVLEKAIPPDVVRFFKENENVIRGALKTNFEANKAKEEFLGINKNEVKDQTPTNIVPNDIPIDKNETPFQRLTRTLNIAEGVKDDPNALNDLAKNVVGESGNQNTWVTPDRYLIAAKRHADRWNKIKTEKQGGLNLVEGSKDIWDLTQMAAFHLEDFYHRNIEPSVSELKNRLRLTLGEAVSSLTDKDYLTLFDKGNELVKANIADPFFSKMKQDAIENLPPSFVATEDFIKENIIPERKILNKKTGEVITIPSKVVTQEGKAKSAAQQAKEFFAEHNNEFIWTAGLEDLINNKENSGEKITKQELIDIINKGQVRVEASVADEQLNNRIQELKTEETAIKNSIDLYSDPNSNLYQYKDENIPIYKDRLNNIYDELDNIQTQYPNISKVKFSLKAYTGEKLELHGAVNSKEVKLITSIDSAEQRLVSNFKQYLNDIEGISPAEFENASSYQQSDILTNYRESIHGKDYVITAETAKDFDVTRPERFYKSPHWNEKDVVAHYRSNDRVTTDGNRIYFSEEFQSDWNHDIRKEYEAGLDTILRRLGDTGKLRLDSISAREARIRELAEKKGKLADYNEEIRRVNSGTKAKPYTNFAQAEADGWRIEEHESRGGHKNYRLVDPAGVFQEARNFETNTRDKVEESFLRSLNEGYGRNIGIEPNPFMSHNWKELVLKRFIRDAVVAKDENGNYKYDGIGWTTARQQMERYGKILEGKNFQWKKNKDGTYTFKSQFNTITWQGMHELDSITLDRFAELTTSEAAQHVRDQEANIPKRFRIYTEGSFVDEYKTRAQAEAAIEKDLQKPYFDSEFEIKEEADPSTINGEFSLKEAIELRKGGDDKYSDYDVALVNMAKKIGKRFGAKYYLKEIDVGFKKDSLKYRLLNADNRTPYDERIFDNRKEVEQEANRLNIPINHVEVLTPEIIKDTQKIHFLEITPSMHESLSREGFSLYGTGGSEALKYPEQGVRNRVVNVDVFNEARSNLIERLSALEKTSESVRDPDHNYQSFDPEQKFKIQESIVNAHPDDLENMRLIMEGAREGSNKGNGVLNSGLNPNAFIDQVKLLYKGFNELGEFTRALVERYGEPIRQFAEDLFYQVKGIATDFKEKLDFKLDPSNYPKSLTLSELKESPAYQLRQGVGTESGRLRIGKKKSPEMESFLTDKTKHQSWFDYRFLMRGQYLAQSQIAFGKVYDSMRLAQRVVNGYQSNIIEQLQLARNVLKGGLDSKVAEVIYEGNETQKVFTNTELSAKGLNNDQIKAYQLTRKAIDNTLNIRLEMKLYGARTKANKLNEKLKLATPGSPEELSLKTQLLDLNDSMTKMTDYYDKLKREGYITLQRRGKIAAFMEDPSFPVGDPDRKLYNHFDNKAEADDWIQANKAKGMINGTFYDVKNLKNIALREKLTPSQFEDLVDRSGVNPTDASIEKIRSEVYSKYPSFTYQLKREYVRGYDKTWQNIVDSTVHQADLYGSSFYSFVGGEEALKALESTGIESSDPNLYEIASKYIKDETQAGDYSFVAKTFGNARRFTYMFQLGYDVNQLYLNAVAQPITQTYGYFSRIKYKGVGLTGVEPEQYFIRGGKLTADFFRGNASKEFNDIVKQLTVEHVLQPEFTRSLIEVEQGTTGQSLAKRAANLKQHEHWASGFMRAGEKTTRTHAAAEAFLIGKEKFNLAGDDLVTFMVKAVDATQSNPTRGENPYAIRALGEGGKLVYQFLAFNQMWWENLGLGLKQSEGIVGKGKFATRELFPLILMGGLRGLPLSAFAATLYTVLTGEDPKKKFDKILGKDTWLEQFATYGFSTSSALSSKLTPSAPVLDSAGELATEDRSVLENIPAYATFAQIYRGLRQLSTKGQRLKGVENISPRAIRGPIKMVEAIKYGVKTTSGDSIIRKKKVTIPQLVGQFINITPTPVSEFYEKQRSEKLRLAIRKSKTGRRVQNRMRQIL